MASNENFSADLDFSFAPQPDGQLQKTAPSQPTQSTPTGPSKYTVSESAPNPIALKEEIPHHALFVWRDMNRLPNGFLRSAHDYQIRWRRNELHQAETIKLHVRLPSTDEDMVISGS